jgi:hypothetical protein
VFGRQDVRTAVAIEVSETMNVLEILAYSGPLPVEDLVWKAGDTPSEALEQIITMADKGLVMVRGIQVEQLRDLRREIGVGQPGNADAALERIHGVLASTRAVVELTKDGLRSAPATA